MMPIFLVGGFCVGIFVGAFMGAERRDQNWNARIERGWYVCDDDREKLCIITVERREVTR